MFAQRSTKVFTISSAKNNHIPRRPKEELIRNLKPILLISRVFGLTPYSISNANLSLSMKGVAHSGLIIIFASYVLYERMNLYYYHSNLEYKLRHLSILRSVLTHLCVYIDVVLSIVCYRKFQSFLNHAWCYDRAMESSKNKKNFFVVRSWILIIFCMVLIFFIGGLTYLCEVDHLKSAIIYIIMYHIFTFGILKFMILAAIILIRLQYLNRSLMRADESEGDHKHLSLGDAWRLHGHLVDAAKKLNSMYSIQLLVWCATLTFNTISRIYTFFTIHENRNIFRNIRESILAAYFIALLTFLAAICSLTANEANKVGSLIFSPKYIRKRYLGYKEDSFIVGQYFLLHSFHFSAAAGFFKVDLPLLLAIAGAMTTYLVILIAPNNC